MSVVPPVVAARLAALAATPGSLQSPNFNISEVDFHSLRAEPGQATQGMWSVAGDEFVFSVVGQLSANHTFLGEYGDLAGLLDDDPAVTFGQLTRAKWKLALVVAASLEETADKDTLRRQLAHLRGLQDQCCSLSPMKRGTGLGLSVVFAWKMGERTTIASDNIYANGLIPAPGEFAAADWPDSRDIFKTLVDDRKDKLVVRPLQLYDSDGERVDMRSAAEVFRPGSWVEVVCALRMWDTSESVAAGRSRRRQAIRSFQLNTGSAQLLSVGRLDEGTLTTRPRPTSLKRSFGPVTSSPTPPAKTVRVEDDPARRAEGVDRDFEMRS